MPYFGAWYFDDMIMRRIKRRASYGLRPFHGNDGRRAASSDGVPL